VTQQEVAAANLAAAKLKASLDPMPTRGTAAYWAWVGRNQRDYWGEIGGSSPAVPAAKPAAKPVASMTGPSVAEWDARVRANATAAREASPALAGAPPPPAPATSVPAVPAAPRGIEATVKAEGGTPSPAPQPLGDTAHAARCTSRRCPLYGRTIGGETPTAPAAARPAETTPAPSAAPCRWPLLALFVLALLWSQT
jgi:hypothetical protein